MNIQFKKFVFFIVLILATIKGSTQDPKLIEFGWDYPDVDQLSNGLSSMQNTPFDGICFSLQRTIMEAFDTAIHNESYFEFQKLKNLKWGKYSDNFIVLRGFGITGGRWFDDEAWKVFTENMLNLSKAMSTGGIRGILFDPEYYYKNILYNPWTYSKAQYPTQSLEEVEEGVKKRGIQFISALQKYKTDLTYISIWLASLISEQKKYTPIQDTRHVLLIPFFEGILEGKNKSVSVVDGNEFAYWNYKPSQFLESAAFLKKNTVELMKSNKAKLEAENITVAQPLFYDGLMVTLPAYEKGFDNASKWKWLEENTKYAMATTNSYVWFYSQKINWWQGKVNDTLVMILQQCKTGLSPAVQYKNKTASPQKPILSNSISINDEKGYYYHTDPKTPMKTGVVAFSFKWNAASGNLQIDFNGKIPASVMIFANNVSSEIKNPIESTMHIKLEKFKKGKIIVLAKYDKTLEASGIQLYNGQ